MKNTMNFMLKAIVFAMVCSQLPLEAAPAKKNKKKQERTVVKKKVIEPQTITVPSMFGKLRSNNEILL
jgi:hypothetical protein